VNRTNFNCIYMLFVSICYMFVDYSWCQLDDIILFHVYFGSVPLVLIECYECLFDLENL
jgi:hypothetical protein